MAWEYELLFDAEAGQTDMPLLWQSIPTEVRVGRMGYRTKTTKAGPRLETEIYPIFGREQTGRLRAARQNATPEAVAKLNYERSRRYMIQLADANFTEEDISLTLTYNGQPPEYEEAQKDIRNFLARVKRLREKRGMDPLKYIYTIEDSKDGRLARIHVHMLMNGGLDRTELEKMWAKGYANADRLQPDENGLEAIARYMTKQQRNRRKWSSSKNLKKPKVRTSDTKVSNGRVKAIARDYMNEAKPVMEKLYPGYQFVKAKVYYSDIVDGVYIRATMRKIDERKGRNHDGCRNFESGTGRGTGRRGGKQATGEAGEHRSTEGRGGSGTDRNAERNE